MRHPSSEEEMVLHQRLLDRDPLAYVDVFLVYMDRIVTHLKRCGYDVDVARDAAIDAVVAYRQSPERYDSRKAHLRTYIMQIAKNKAVDRLRPLLAEARREKTQGDVELLRRSPKEGMEKIETFVKVRQLMDQLERGGRLKEQDWILLRLFLTGDGSTEEAAKVLRLPSMSKEERKQEVKRLRDRLMKLLKRSGKEDSDDES